MARETRMPEDARKIAYDDLRKLADSSFKGDIKAAVYSLDPKVVTATVDSFGGNIDRTNRPMYIHRDKDGKITGYSTTNSGDALDKGVKPEGRFQSVLVPFVRQGKDGPEYTEDYNVAQKWYDESGQHYGKFDMDFTNPEAKSRSIDRFNAASWLVHREQVLRYQPEFDRLVEAERRQAAKAGDAGSSKSTAVPKGHNPALDGYAGPRIVINPSVFKDEKDALCVSFDEAFRIIMEMNGFDPVSEPTEKQRKFFSDTAYAGDERMLRRTILARICTFDTSISDPTDEQLQEAVEFLDTVMEIGAPQNQWEQRAVERIMAAIEKSVGQPRAEEPAPEPPAEGPAVAAAGGGETEEEALKRLTEGDTGATAQEDKSTIEEREKFLEERGMDKSLAETGSMDTLVKMHEQQNGVPAHGGVDTQPAADPGKSDLFGQNGTEQITEQDAKDFVAGAQDAPAQPAAPAQEQAAAAPQQETLAPGLSRSGSRNNILEFDGRRVSQREFDRIQAKFQEGGEQKPTGVGGRELTAGEAAWQAKRQSTTDAWMQRTGRNAVAEPAEEPPVQVAANDDEPLKPNNLRQSTQVDSGRRDALGRRLDDRGRVIA